MLLFQLRSLLVSLKLPIHEVKSIDEHSVSTVATVITDFFMLFCFLRLKSGIFFFVLI